MERSIISERNTKKVKAGLFMKIGIPIVAAAELLSACGGGNKITSNVKPKANIASASTMPKANSSTSTAKSQSPNAVQSGELLPYLPNYEKISGMKEVLNPADFPAFNPTPEAQTYINKWKTEATMANAVVNGTPNQNPSVYALGEAIHFYLNYKFYSGPEANAKQVASVSNGYEISVDYPFEVDTPNGPDVAFQIAGTPINNWYWARVPQSQMVKTVQTNSQFQDQYSLQPSFKWEYPTTTTELGSTPMADVVYTGNPDSLFELIDPTDSGTGYQVEPTDQIPVAIGYETEPNSINGYYTGQ